MTGEKILRWGLAGLLLFLAVAACQPAAEKPAASAVPPGIDKSYRQGALALEYRLSRQELSVAERLELVLTAVTPENRALRFPPAEAKLGGFKVVEARRDPPRLLPGGEVESRQHYLLEPFLAGEYILPPLTVSSWVQGEQEAAPDEVATAEEKVTVRSLLAGEEKEAAAGDILPPAVQPHDPRFLLALAAGAVAGLLLLFFLWRWWRRRLPRERQTPSLPPHTRAYQALEQLLASELLARGEVKSFHFAVSDILRHYIEERFALQAPERTTEEFLAIEAGTIEHRHRLLLKEFLSHCDLVKFAEHRPGAPEIERMVTLCRQFISETEPKVLDQTSSKKFAAGGTVPHHKPRGRRLG